MGKPGYKETTDGLLWLDTAQLSKEGCLKAQMSVTQWWTRRADGHRYSASLDSYPLEDQPFIRLRYTATDNFTGAKQEYDYNILLGTTPCYFGGKRWWFYCPLIRDGNPCINRIRKLYKRGSYFGCRECLQLAYPSQNENHHNAWAVVGKFITYENWVNELVEQIKVPYHRGKPTRKMRRYLQLMERLENKEAVYLKFAQWLQKGLQL